MKVMINIFTIGTNGKSAKEFFETLISNSIDLLIDVRLNNKSQLAGFSKGGEEYLGYLLNKVCDIEYIHDPYLAPTEDILDRYHKDKNWSNYVNSFNNLIKKRNIKEYFQKTYNSYKNICLLCAEKNAEQCHRRLIAEAICKNENIFHL